MSSKFVLFGVTSAVSVAVAATAVCVVFPIVAAHQAKSRNPSDSATIQNKIDLLVNIPTREAEAAVNEGDLDKAVRLLKQSALDVPLPATFFALGQVLDQKGEYGGAKDAYHSAIYPPPNVGSSTQSDPNLLVRYAELCETGNEDEEAARMYKRVVDGYGKNTIGPQYPSVPSQPDPADVKAIAYVKLGIAQSFGARQATQEKAINSFRTAARSRPNLAVTQFYYGYELKELGYRQHNVNQAQGGATLAQAVAVLKRAEALGRADVKEAALREGRNLPGFADVATPDPATVTAHE